ncbi:MAG: hypothetical protein V1784_10575 [bacterium]
MFLLVLFLAFLSLPALSWAGLRDILPPPQQMGILADEPMQIQGTLYIVTANGDEAAEGRVLGEAMRLLERSLNLRPVALSWSSYNGQRPALWMGTSGNFPALVAALDSVGIPSMSGAPPLEGYHLYVGANRILLLGRDSNGLRYGLLSLSKVAAFFGGQRIVERVYIRDWPDLSRRTITFNSALEPTGDLDSLLSRLSQAYEFKMNEVEWNNTYSGRGLDWNSTYLSRAITARDSIKALGMKLYMSADRTGAVVDNFCWNEGVPVLAQTLLIAGDTAQALPNPSFTVNNPGFEQFSNGQFVGWGNSQVSYPTISQDVTQKHGGVGSLKLQWPGDQQSKVYQDFAFPAYRLYQVSFWYKTSGYSGLIRLMLWRPDCNDQQIFLHYFRPSATSDWTQVNLEVHSLMGGTLRLYLGAWQWQAGTLWLDDFSIREKNPTWMLRRDDTPLSVYKEPGHILLQEGSNRDFTVEETYSQSYGSCYVNSPRIRRVAGGRLANGDQITMDWYCAYAYRITPQEYRRTVCFSLLEPLAFYQQKISNCDSLFKPDGFKIHINEVPIANWDPSCTSRGLTPAQLIGSYVRQMYNIIQARRPGAPVQVYGDMFDPFHNARNCHWGMNGTIAGSLSELQGLPIVLLGLQGSRIDSSLNYFSQNGFPSIAAHGGTSLQVGLTEAEAARRQRSGGCQGASLYSWYWSDYDSIPSFSSMLWNLGPHIVHKPLVFTDSAAVAHIAAEIFPDRQPPYLQISLSSARVHYRLLPGGSWQSATLVSQGAELYAADISLSAPGTSGIEYYVEATDSRNRTHTAPADAPFSTFAASFPAYGGGQRQEELESPVATITFANGRPVVRWTPVKGATSYEVHAGPEPFFKPVPSTWRATLPAPMTVFAEMTPLSMLPDRFFYRVVALNTPTPGNLAQNSE